MESKQALCILVVSVISFKVFLASKMSKVTRLHFFELPALFFSYSGRHNMNETPSEGSDSTTENNSVTSEETVIKTGLLVHQKIRSRLFKIFRVSLFTNPLIHGIPL